MVNSEQRIVYDYSSADAKMNSCKARTINSKLSTLDEN